MREESTIKFAIMQKAPFPGHWRLMPSYQLEEAEWELRFNHQHYYERATSISAYRPTSPVSRVWLYSWDDALSIMDYWRAKMSFAEFMVIGHWLTPDRG